RFLLMIRVRGPLQLSHRTPDEALRDGDFPLLDRPASRRVVEGTPAATGSARADDPAAYRRAGA
ncbi:MAG: hypothetical protein JXB36_07790, partial [Gammaproteobacteria bacterium]|nr:hypothetical protein [Gammaproteobacteria bacterium]